MKHQLANKSALKDESKKTLPSASLQSKPPEQATMHPVLRLQRAIGNQAVQNMVRSGGMAGQPRRSSPEAISPRVDNVLRSPGQPLAPATRTFMETRFGKDFSNVRVHTDAQAVESARSINALAYTVGSDMVFGAGQYAPETIRGRRLVAHELTHTIQQTHQKQFSGSMKISEPTGAMEREAQYVAHAIMHSQPFTVTSRADKEIARQDDAGTSPPDATPSGGVPADPNAGEKNEDSVEISALLEEAEDEGGTGDEIKRAILEGGAGVAYGAVQALTPGGFLAPSPAPQSRRFEFFRAAGQIATGIAELVGGVGGEALGLGLDVTGVGTAAGVALNIGSAVVIANAATNVVAGVKGLANAMSMQGDGGGGRLPKKGTPERAAIENARRRGIRGAQSRELENIRAGGKGSGVWTDAELEQIRKTGEFPKDVRWHHDPTVANRPELADDPSVVRPVRGGVPGHLAAHGGDFRK